MGWTKVTLLIFQRSKTFRIFDIIRSCSLTQIFFLCIMILQVLIYIFWNYSNLKVVTSPFPLWLYLQLCNSGSIFELILYVTLLNVKARKREHRVQQCASNNEQCGNQSETTEESSASPCLVLCSHLQAWNPSAWYNSISTVLISCVYKQKKQARENDYACPREICSVIVCNQTCNQPLIKHLINYLYFSF